MMINIKIDLKEFQNYEFKTYNPKDEFNKILGKEWIEFYKCRADSEYGHLKNDE